MKLPTPRGIGVQVVPAMTPEERAAAERRGHEGFAELCRDVAAGGFADRYSTERIERSVKRVRLEIDQLKGELAKAPDRRRELQERLEELREELAVRSLALELLANPPELPASHLALVEGQG